jgi:hypothetical protein
MGTLETTAGCYKMSAETLRNANAAELVKIEILLSR